MRVLCLRRKNQRLDVRLESHDHFYRVALKLKQLSLWFTEVSSCGWKKLVVQFCMGGNEGRTPLKIHWDGRIQYICRCLVRRNVSAQAGGTRGVKLRGRKNVKKEKTKNEDDKYRRVRGEKNENFRTY